MATAGAYTLIEASTPTAGIRLIVLNRPSKRNALSFKLMEEFLSELSKASQDTATKAIVITGGGTFFSAGADLADIAALDTQGAHSCRYLEPLCNVMASVRKPLIAAVNGPALGGGFEVALMCDLICASKSAYFALPETARGLIPGAGGTQRLTAAVGKFRAMQTILLGKSITAEQALDWGLACDLADGPDFLGRVINVTSEMLSRSPTALEFAKEAICHADSLSRDDKYERNLYYATFSTAEKKAGVDGFLAKPSHKVAEAAANGGHEGS